jgi:hypothetical protein
MVDWGITPFRTRSPLQKVQKTLKLPHSTYGSRFLALVVYMTMRAQAAELLVDFYMTSDRRFFLSAESLSHTWDIGIVATKITLEATTQRGVRTVAFPSIERRRKTGDRPLWYFRLNHAVYHDTLNSRVTSLSGNKCSESVQQTLVGQGISQSRKSQMFMRH